MTTKTITVTPGRVAFLVPGKKRQITDKPVTVVWNSYYEELLNVHGDIQIVPPAEPDTANPAVSAAASLAAKVHVNTINTAAVGAAS